MLKLKLMTAILAVAGLVMFLMGSTYLTTSCSVICTAAALSLSLHLVFRWLTGEQYDYLLWFFLAGAYIISGSMAISVLQYIGAMDVPLSATIDNAQKMGDVGQYVSIANIVSILLSVSVPRRSPTCDDDSDNKG